MAERTVCMRIKSRARLIATFLRLRQALTRPEAEDHNERKILQPSRLLPVLHQITGAIDSILSHMVEDFTKVLRFSHGQDTVGGQAASCSRVRT